jgi:biotin transport system permease protein
MLDLYSPGSSILHRLAPGIKVSALMLCGSLLFLVDGLLIPSIALGFVVGLYRVAGLTMAQLWAQLRPAALLLVILFLVQGLITGWGVAVFIVLRFGVLLLLAGLVTLTTRSSDMIEAITRGLGWLRWIGVNPSKVGLAFSLALRFIPVLATLTKEVREAQKARGLERSIIAVAIPVTVRMLKMADDISDAIDARGYTP